MDNIESMRVKKIIQENEILLNRIKTLKEENEVLRKVGDVEVLTTEEAAIELGQGTIYSTYDWYNTLNQFKNLGLSVCKVEGIKDDAEQIEFAHGTCKDCKYSDGRYITREGQIDQNEYCRCEKYNCEFRKLNFYCADFEKRDNENKGVD